MTIIRKNFALLKSSKECWKPSGPSKLNFVPFHTLYLRWSLANCNLDPYDCTANVALSIVFAFEEAEIDELFCILSGHNSKLQLYRADAKELDPFPIWTIFLLKEFSLFPQLSAAHIFKQCPRVYLLGFLFQVTDTILFCKFQKHLNKLIN